MTSTSLLYAYVLGTDSFSPCVGRGFNEIAYDAVEWWDASRRRVADGVLLIEHLTKAISGDRTGPLRAIRPVGGASEGSFAHATFESVRDVVDARAPRHQRMRRLAALLDSYAKAGMVPGTGLERAAELHVCSGIASPDRTDGVDGDSAWTGSIFAVPAGKRSEIRAFVVDALEDVSASSRVDRVILYDTGQRDYFRKVIGRDVLEIFPQASVLVTQREFSRREGIGRGLPLESALRVAGVDPEATGGNRALAMHLLDVTQGMSDLLSGLSTACDLPVRFIVDTPLSGRCARMVGVPSVVKKPAPTDHAPVAVRGGMVIEPRVGVHHDPVVVLDFRSMYPSVLAAEPDGEFAEISRVVSGLIDRRREAESRGDGVAAAGCKLMANSVYGQLGNRRSPLYDPSLANCVTERGRSLLVSLKEAVEQGGGTVVYGDTDSCMASFAGSGGSSESAEAAAHAIARAFNNDLPEPIRVGVDDVFVRSLFVGKKRYVGIDRHGRFHYRGTLNRRSDVPACVHRAYETAIASILGSDAPCSEGGWRDIARRANAVLDEAPDDEFVAVRRVSDECQEFAGLAVSESIGFADAYTPGDAIEFLYAISPVGERAVRVRLSDGWQIDRERYRKLLNTALATTFCAAYGGNEGDYRPVACRHMFAGLS